MLDFLFSADAKLLNCFAIAFQARHGYPPLALCGDKADNKFGFELPTPRLDSPADCFRSKQGPCYLEPNGSRRLNFDFHRLIDQVNCDLYSQRCLILSESPCVSAQGLSYLIRNSFDVR